MNEFRYVVSPLMYLTLKKEISEKGDKEVTNEMVAKYLSETRGFMLPISEVVIEGKMK